MKRKRKCEACYQIFFFIFFLQKDSLLQVFLSECCALPAGPSSHSQRESAYRMLRSCECLIFRVASSRKETFCSRRMLAVKEIDKCKLNSFCTKITPTSKITSQLSKTKQKKFTDFWVWFFFWWWWWCNTPLIYWLTWCRLVFGLTGRVLRSFCHFKHFLIITVVREHKNTLEPTGNSFRDQCASDKLVWKIMVKCIIGGAFTFVYNKPPKKVCEEFEPLLLFSPEQPANCCLSHSVPSVPKNCWSCFFPQFATKFRSCLA